MKVKDEIKGIGAIWKVYSNRDVTIFYIDVNTILKGEEPAWYGASDGRASLIWHDPRWKGRGRLKTAEINFGNFKDYAVSHQMSRYTCIVTFFRRKLLEKVINRPLYQD